jgi:hypothetical protein
MVKAFHIAKVTNSIDRCCIMEMHSMIFIIISLLDVDRTNSMGNSAFLN